MLPKERPIRIQLDMNVMQSKVTNKVQWAYPHEILETVMKQHINGKVLIHLLLDSNGKIKETNVVEGAPILADPVLQAVKQWTFEPTMLDGERVEVELNLETGFKINGKY